MAKVYTIALDNGHGLNTSGKRTPVFTDGTKSPYTGKNFMHEWEFNRRVVQLLKPMLERCGFRVIETSPTETDTPISTRYKRANELNVDYLLSVHANALKDYWNDANGVETLVKEGAKIECYRIGRILQKHLVSATGLRDRCKSLPPGLVERSNLGILNGAKMPVNLIECGFMDNPKEAKLLLSENYRMLIADAVCKALCEAFDVKFIPELKVVQPRMSDVFKDVPAGHWAEKDLKLLKDAGIVSGYKDGTFKGDQPLTRYEAAAMMAALLRKGVK